KRDVVLPTVLSDWRELSSRVSTRFDAVLCLGNSFTHLFDESDRVAALAEFHQVLRPGGILIIDQRNYDRILDHGFSTKHAYYYCGRGVTAQPITVDASAVSFEYSFPDGSKHHLTLHPLRKQALTSLVHRVGFRDVETYGDFSAHWDLASTDFLVHVATKP
ncbi:class I SAM-dependent methyltransferase, partial [Myxococcota bacterium]|nr:class I SAM-dependent methyltransferase [Myxococcota bacterium]